MVCLRPRATSVRHILYLLTIYVGQTKAPKILCWISSLLPLVRSLPQWTLTLDPIFGIHLMMKNLKNRKKKFSKAGKEGCVWSGCNAAIGNPPIRFYTSKFKIQKLYGGYEHSYPWSAVTCDICSVLT